MPRRICSLTIRYELLLPRVFTGQLYEPYSRMSVMVSTAAAKGAHTPQPAMIIGTFDLSRKQQGCLSDT